VFQPRAVAAEPIECDHHDARAWMVEQEVVTRVGLQVMGLRLCKTRRSTRKAGSAHCAILSCSAQLTTGVINSEDIDV
jgi:hypothetical protein